MRAIVIGLCLILLFACLPLGFRVKNGPASNFVCAQSFAESCTSIIASFLKGCYSLLGYFNVIFSAIVNLFIGCYASIAITAPEFTSGFMAGCFTPVLGGYMLVSLLHPIGWVALFLTFVLGFPIPLPLELLCAGLGLIPGFFMGLILGTMNLLNRPTPGEIMISQLNTS